MKRGYFITLEGIEGCGKSTQAILLRDKLASAGREVVLTRSPGGTPVAEKIRELLKKRTADDELRPETELLLFAACHSQLTENLVKPALARGADVVCDRFTDSTTAYQGYARGLDLRHIAEANKFSCGGLEPDLTILLDLPPELGLERAAGRGAALEKDRFDSETLNFHKAVRAGFLELASQFKNRFGIVDDAAEPDLIHKKIMELIHARLEIL